MKLDSPSSIWQMPTNLNSLFNKFPSENYKKMYGLYPEINMKINKLFTDALHIIYNGYENFCIFKENKELYEKFFYEYENYRGSDTSILDNNDKFFDTNDRNVTKFSNFFHIYKSMITKDGDVYGFLLGDKYFSAVEEIRESLKIDSNSIDNALISYDVENFPELRVSSPMLYESYLGVKIRPFLVDGSYESGVHANVTPDVKYKVIFDINKILSIITVNCAMPDDYPVEEAFDKEAYFAKQREVITPLVEKYSKCVVLEWMTVEGNLRTGMEAFTQKCARMYSKVSTDGPMTRIIDNVNYTIKKHSNEKDLNHTISTFEDSASNLIGMYNPNENTSGWASADSMSMFVHSDGFNTLLKGYLGEAEYDDSIDTMLYKITRLIFWKTFSHYFESTAIFYINIKLPEESTVNQLYIEEYNREFNQKYDFGVLLTNAGSIEDYVSRDFFISIINEMKKMPLRARDTIKYSNGEKQSFMFSKHKRMIWMNMLSTFQLISKINPNINELIGKGGRNKIMLGEYTDFVKKTFLILVKIASSVGICPDTRAHLTNPKGHINQTYRYIHEYATLYRAKIYQSESYSRLLQSFVKKTKCGTVFTVYSYDYQHIYEYLNYDDKDKLSINDFDTVAISQKITDLFSHTDSYF